MTIATKCISVQANILHHDYPQEKKPPHYYVAKRLQKIKEMAVELIAVADSALADIRSVEEIRVMRWRCKFCGLPAPFSVPSLVVPS